MKEVLDEQTKQELLDFVEDLRTLANDIDYQVKTGEVYTLDLYLWENIKELLEK